MANIFDQFDQPEQKKTGSNVFDQFDAPVVPAPKDPGVLDYAAQIAKGAALVPGEATMAFRGAMRGREGAAESGDANAPALETMRKRQEFTQQTRERLGDGFVSQMVQSVPDLGYTAATIPVAMVGGKTAALASAPVAAASGPYAPLVAGGAALIGGAASTYPMMARSDEYRNALELLSQANEERKKKGLSPFSTEEAKGYLDQYESQLIESGQWEAGPEALSTAIDALLLSRLPGGSLAKKAVKTAAGIVASEWPMETITSIGQSQALQGTPIAPEKEYDFAKPGDWVEAAKETLPAVLTMAGTTTAIGAAGAKVYDTVSLKVRDLNTKIDEANQAGDTQAAQELQAEVDQLYSQFGPEVGGAFDRGNTRASAGLDEGQLGEVIDPRIQQERLAEIDRKIANLQQTAKISATAKKNLESLRQERTKLLPAPTAISQGFDRDPAKFYPTDTQDEPQRGSEPGTQELTADSLEQLRQNPEVQKAAQRQEAVKSRIAELTGKKRLSPKQREELSTLQGEASNAVSGMRAPGRQVRQEVQELRNEAPQVGAVPDISPQEAATAYAQAKDELTRTDPESDRYAQLSIMAEQYGQIMSGQKKAADFAPAIDREAAAADARSIRESAAGAETLVIDGNKKNATVSANSVLGRWFLDNDISAGEAAAALEKHAEGKPLTEKQQQAVSLWKDDLDRKLNTLPTLPEEDYDTAWQQDHRLIQNAYTKAKAVDENAADAIMDSDLSDGEVLSRLISLMEERRGPESERSAGVEPQAGAAEPATQTLPAQKVGEDGKLFATPPTFGKGEKKQNATLDDMALYSEPLERADAAKQTDLFGQSEGQFTVEPSDEGWVAKDTNGNIIGTLATEFENGTGTPNKPAFAADVRVDEKWRRKGVATSLYEQFSKAHNGNITPSTTQTDDGSAFWAGRQKPQSPASPEVKQEAKQPEAAKQQLRKTETKTERATTILGYGGQEDGFAITTPDGAKATGYVRNSDFPGQKDSPTRGELFYVEVPENLRGKGAGKKLAIDALRLMKENGAETVNFSATSKNGQSLIDSLIKTGMVSQPIQKSATGKAEYEILLGLPSKRQQPADSPKTLPASPESGNPQVEVFTDKREDTRSGDILKDGNGNEYLFMGMRFGSAEVFPIVNGKASVSSETGIRWNVGEGAKERYPDRRSEPLYRTGRNYYDEENAKQSSRPVNQDGSRLPAQREENKQSQTKEVIASGQNADEGQYAQRNAAQGDAPQRAPLQGQVVKAPPVSQPGDAQAAKVKALSSKKTTALVVTDPTIKADGYVFVDDGKKMISVNAKGEEKTASPIFAGRIRRAAKEGKTAPYQSPDAGNVVSPAQAQVGQTPLSDEYAVQAGDVLAPGKRPFKSKVAAENVRKTRGMTKTHRLVAVTDGYALRQNETAPAQPQAAPVEEKPNRFDLGSALSKEQRKKVLDTLTDVYVETGVQKEQRIDARGEEYWAYPHTPDVFRKSDITGAMVRYYVLLPDGKIAHPSELFPEMTQTAIDTKLAEEQYKANQEKLSIKEQNERADRWASPNRYTARENAVAAQQSYFNAHKDAFDRLKDLYSEKEGKWLASLTPDKMEAALSGRGYKQVKTFRAIGGQSEQKSWFPKEYTDGTAPVEAAPAKAEEKAKDVTPAAKTVPAPETKPAAQGEGKTISDFGETISGAKKMLYAEAYGDKMREAKNVDIAAEPLSKSWPEANHEKLIEDGADAWTVAFIRSLRDEIPTKPQQGYKLSRWVTLVKQLRHHADRLMSGDLTRETLEGLFDKDNLKGLGEDLQNRADLYLAVGHSQSLKGVKLSAGRYGMYNGEKFNPPKTLWAITMKAKGGPFGNWPKELAVAESREKAIAAFMERFDTLDLGPKKKEHTFIIYRKTNGEKGYFIGKKIGKDYIDLEKFEDAKDARKYLSENLDKLNAKLAKFKNIPNERREDNSPRVGEDHRQGVDVTPEMFMESFAPKGVQFGNYVEGDKRQQDLNQAYDALMDLAGVLGLPPKSLFLNGELGLAFGARGSGGKGAGGRTAAAHYEPAQVVINLTKRSGAGSLAHEWWHSVDNYFSRMRGDAAGFLTDRAYDRGEGVRPEMVQAFRRVMNTITASGLRKRAALLDRKLTKDYWGTNVEMSARSFESYVIAKLNDQSASNDYLANIVSPEYWKAATALGLEEENSYPYPTAAEVPEIRAAFDDFFKTVQTRETDKGTAMYSVADQTETPVRGKEDFFALASAQRGAPESAMLAVQRIMGGGVLNPLVEHIGDLTHRMAERPTFETAGYEFVKEKVERGLRYLKDGYGFSREFEENIKGNAKYYIQKGKYKDEHEYRKSLISAMDKYADEHSNLPTFNRAQNLAQSAAVAIGSREWGAAIDALEELNSHLKSKDKWVEFAHAGYRNPGIRYSTAPAPDNVTAETVKSAFPTGKVEEKNGSFHVDLPSGASVIVKTGEVIQIDEGAYSKGYGQAPDKGIVAVGEFRNLGAVGIIRLAKMAGAETLDHETFHAAMALALNENQRKLVLAQYGSEEKAARAYEKWTPAKGGVFRYIYDFFRNMLSLFKPQTVDSIFRDIKSGKVWGQHGQGAQSIAFSTQEKARAFFSKLSQVLESKMPAKMNAADFLRWLQKPEQGITKAELEQSGILAEVEGKKTVSKEDMAGLAQANAVELEDVVLGGRELSSQWEEFKGGVRRKISNRWTHIWANQDGSVVGQGPSKYNRRFGSIEEAKDYYDAMDVSASITPTQFSQYQEPGAVEGSYREMFVTAPKAGAERFKTLNDRFLQGILTAEEKVEYGDLVARKAYKDVWQDGHSQYDQIQNPIVRLRFNERQGPKGERILFIEEMQGPSDKNQEKMPEYLRKRIYDLGVKRALAFAKANGFDGIAWTTGEMQASRYDLSKQVEKIEYWDQVATSSASGKESRAINIDLIGGVTMSVEVDKSGEVLWAYGQSALVGKSLDEVIGKDLAKQILEASKGGTIEGEGLSIGGEGLKSLYDKMLPSLFKKYGKEGVQEFDLGEDRAVAGTKVTYEGPEYTASDLFAKAKQANNEVSVSVGNALRNAAYSMEVEKKTFSEVAEWDLSEAAAEFIGGKLVKEYGRRTAPGVPVTDKTPARYPVYRADQTFYHGTGQDFNAFNIPSWFTTKPKVAGIYANAKQGNQRVIPVRIKLENPVTLTFDEIKSLSAGQVRAYRLAGFDGATHQAKDETIAVPFAPEQIRSTFNDEPFGTAANYSVRDILPERFRGGIGPAPSVLENAGPKVKNAIDYLRMKFQDKFLPLLRLQQKLQAEGWQKTTENDAYRAEELFHGKAAKRLEDFYEGTVKTFMASVKDSGVSVDELESYLYAKFAPQRNAYIASINPDMPDGGSGMSNAEAAQILRDLSGKGPELEALAGKVRELTAMQRDTIRDEGLEGEDLVEAWELGSPDYVPLKGGKEEAGKGIGTGFNVKGSGTKRALGRKSKAENILAHLFEQVGTTIVRAEKVKVSRAFLRMVEDNPQSDLFEIMDKLPTKRVLGTNPQATALRRRISEMKRSLRSGQLGAQERQAVQQRLKDAQDALATLPPNVVTEVADFSEDAQKNILTVTDEDGSVVHVRINDDDLARVMKNQTHGQFDKTVKYMGMVTRFLSRMSTSLNPEFVVTNFERDIQTAMVHLGGEGSAKLAKDVLKSVFPAMKGIHNALRKNGSSEWAQWFDRYQKAGAQVSFMDLRGVSDWETKIKALASEGGMSATRENIRKIGQAIGDYNSMVENAVRLASFRKAIESGVSESDAASLAKNLTVNFNRKGELGPAINSLYMFANAGIQGSARILTAVGKSSRVRKMMLAATGMAWGLAEMNRLVGDDDDDENKWDKVVTDYTKQVNLVFMMPSGDILKIRLPYGYNVFAAMGYALSDVLHWSMGDGGKSPVEAAGFMTSAIMNAFNPFGGDENMLKILAPTLADPLVEIATNENFTGQPIRPENFHFGPQKPESQLYFRSVSTASREIAELLNSFSGGSKWEPGLIDISPETFDHMAGFVLGGLGKTVGRTLDLPGKVLNDDLTPNVVPFLRQVYQIPSDRIEVNQFYDRVNKISSSRANYKEMPASERPKYFKDHPEVQLFTVAGRFQRQLSNLRERYNAAMDEGNKAQAKQIETQMREAAARFNRIYHDRVGR